MDPVASPGVAPQRAFRAPLAALALALAAAALVDRLAPFPSADVARGSEEAFARGIHPRELSRQGPQRWSTPRATFRFRNLPPGPATLEVGVRATAAPVTLVVNGVALATLNDARHARKVPLPWTGGEVEVALVSEGRETGGRRIAALLDRVTLRHQRRALPGVGLILLFGAPALVVCLAARFGGLGPGWATALAASATLTQAAALWPCGLARSDYAPRLGLLLALGAVACAALARWFARALPGAAPWACASLLGAWLVHLVAATSPLMVVSDAVFHANKLAAVARGDFFPLSVTQHATPFRFPYGVSFYALLAPAFHAGLDPVNVVRFGAGLSGFAASAALFGMLAATPRRAALAVLALQLLPGAFEVYSFGNLSNVFAQALTVAFFAWWVGRARGGALAGGLLFACGCLAHFSALIVLAALGAALVLVRPREVLADRARIGALIVGGLLSALYYGQFVGLIVDQLPRLRESAGAGRTAGLAIGAALFEQGRWALARWGAPAMALAVLGWPRPRRAPFERDLLAFWLAGASWLAFAIASPLEVRYLYALTLPLAVAAAAGVERLAEWGTAGRLAAALALAAQAWLFARGLLEALLLRYR